MNNNITQHSENKTEQYCLDLPSSQDFHALLSSTAPNYNTFVNRAKGLLSDYFTKQGIETKIIINTCDDLDMSPQGAFQVIKADLSFTCRPEDFERLSENINDVFKAITPENIISTANWKNLPLQKYPIWGKF